MDDSTLVEQFTALGDLVRWAIGREVGAGARCACGVSQVLEVSPPLRSHHLEVLREAGLIVGTRRGRWIDDELRTDALAALVTWAEHETVGSRTRDAGPADSPSVDVFSDPASGVGDAANCRSRLVAPPDGIGAG